MTIHLQTAEATPTNLNLALPRVGFLGVGWIGKNRLEAIAATGVVEVAAIADPAEEVVAQAAKSAPGAQVMRSLDELLEADLDALVIATPSALHAEQAITALERGLAVFCQKPLARTSQETRRVVHAARAADRLLGVDLSYRHVRGMSVVKEAVEAGELGEIYAANLVFHNAYGPDKAWFYDPALSGGGCVIDLGIHVVDLALWVLGFPEVEAVTSRLYSQGKLLEADAHTVEDYATARLDLAGGTTLQLSCSWKLPAGRDAIIEASFYGTEGGAALRNLDGSFYDFVVERYRGTSTETISEPHDAWGGRAATEWANRLAVSNRYDPELQHLIEVAAALDGVYGR